MKRNEKEHAEKIPVITEDVKFYYSSGLYKFFCKTTAKLFIALFAILSFVKDPGATLEKRKYDILVSCIWIVNHIDNKLEGICSVSSSVCDNLLCKARQNIVDCICASCYAASQQARQYGLREHNIINGLVLRNVLIPVKAFRALVIIFPYLRIESFGDVANVIQARNYIRIIKAFPRKRCAIWSKNLAIWDAAFKAEGGKPNNTTFVVSSPYVNKPIAETIVEQYPFIDHIFTVYTKAYARKHNIKINCGGRKCLECIKRRINCYFRTSAKNDTLYINEIKK